MKRESLSPPLQKPDRLWIGILMTIASSLSYALYSFFSKISQADGTSFYQVSFFSFFLSWVGFAPFFLRKKHFSLKTQCFPLHLARLVFGVAIVYLFVISLQSISLVNAVMLNNTAPLFVPIIAFFWLKQKLNHRIWISVALGLFGVGLILKPSANMLNEGGVFALLSGISMGFSWVSIRKLTHTEPSSRIIFHFLSLASLVTAIPLIWNWKPLNIVQWENLLLVGLCYLSTTVFFIMGCKLIPITLVSILFYLTIVFTALLDWFIWHELPGLLTTAGILCVSAGGILSILIERKQKT